MRLKIMTTEAIAYIKNNIDLVVNHYINKENPEEWLKLALNKPAFREIDELDFPDFQLLINKEIPSATDIENIKIFYSNLLELNDSFATDERLWAGLANSVFFEYVIDRFPLTSDTKEAGKSVLNHFFFNMGSPRSYMVNTLARLWWIGKKTYLSENDDHWSVLNFMSHDINGYAFTLFGSNWSNSEKSLNLFFDAIFRFEKATKESVGRALFNDSMKYMNCLCGIYAVDACDKEFISTKVYEFLLRRNDEIKLEEIENKKQNIRKTGIAKLDLIIKNINELGGMASVSEIFLKFGQTGEVTENLREYIRDSLEKYCPDCKKYDGSGKMIFYKTKRNNQLVWRVSRAYLAMYNEEKRNRFVLANINALVGMDKLVFNSIAAVQRNKVTYVEIMQLANRFNDILGKIDNLKQTVDYALQYLCQAGIVEYQREDNCFLKCF